MGVFDVLEKGDKSKVHLGPSTPSSEHKNFSLLGPLPSSPKARRMGMMDTNLMVCGGGGSYSDCDTWMGEDTHGESAVACWRTNSAAAARTCSRTEEGRSSSVFALQYLRGIRIWQLIDE